MERTNASAIKADTLPGANDDAVLVRFDSLEIGQKFYDPPTRRRYVKVDRYSARELVPEPEGRAGFAYEERVYPLTD